MSWFEKTIKSVAPRYALKRAQAQLALQVISNHKRKYDSASKGRRTEGWKTTGASANSEILPALAILRNRSRDLVRNNGYANKAVRSIASNMVGTGIIPQAKASSAKIKDETQRLWEMWGETTLCDADGLLDFYGIQNLVVREIAEAGEVLIRKVRKPSSSNLPIPIQLQVLEADHIDTFKYETLPDGNKVIQGVEYDKSGARAAYWLYPEHPGDSFQRIEYTSITSKRIPASEIIHLFRVERAGQARGVPWGAPVLIRLRDFDEYEDAQLIRQKIASCFTAFVHDADAGDLTETQQELAEKVEPGMIELLPPGKSVTFGTPPSVAGFKEYSDVTLHEVAAGYGVTYEELTGDLSGVNFSSGRMGWLSYQRELEQWRWLMMIPGLCQRTWGWFLEGATLEGFSTNRVTASWTPPRREMIDPTREVPATIKAVRGGLQSLSEAVRERGVDPQTHFNEMKKDADMLDKLGLVLDSDPRKTTEAGNMNAPAEVKDDEDESSGGTK